MFNPGEAVGLFPFQIYFMKILVTTMLAAVSVHSLTACDFCAVYTTTEAHDGKGFYAGLAEQFTHFGTMQDEGKVVPNVAGQSLDSVISQVFAGYNFNDRFGVQLNLPVIYRSFKRPEGFATDRGSESGLGDISLLGKFTAYRHHTEETTVLVGLFGGVKFPTGSSRRIAEELHETEVEGAPESGIHGHDLTLGSGSFDGLFGVNFYARIQRGFFAANVQYSLRTQGDYAYEFANDLTWSGGPGALLVLRENFTLSLQANVSGETKGRDTFQGAQAGDTGITSVYLGPEITATWRDRLSAELGADIPVSIANTALQTVPDYRIHAALTWRF